jgi:hypothetical protein
MLEFVFGVWKMTVRRGAFGVRKPKRKYTNRERTEQKNFIKLLRTKFKYARPYIYVDKDSEDRVFEADWDFFIETNDIVSLIECKFPSPERKRFVKDHPKLRSNQEIAKAEVNASGGNYLVLEFFADKSPILHVPIKGTKMYRQYDAYRYLLNKHDKRVNV